MIAQFLQEKKLAPDRDAALKQIVKSLKLLERTGKMNNDQFIKLFARSIFKDSMIDVLHDIEVGIALQINVHGGDSIVHASQRKLGRNDSKDASAKRKVNLGLDINMY